MRAIKAEGVALAAAVAVVGEQRFVLNDAESRDGKLPLHAEETLRERGAARTCNYHKLIKALGVLMCDLHNAPLSPPCLQSCHIS